MLEKGFYQLETDIELKRLIPPLSPEELKQLEVNIIRDGCREPLCVWENTILDGHNRYELCKKLKIPFSVQIITLNNHEEAIAWVCANQLGRRNINEATRKYLIGKRYEMEKLNGARNQKGINQYSKKEVWGKMFPKPLCDDSASRTREKLGKEYHVSDKTIYKYGTYAQAIDTLSQTSPMLASNILSGSVKASHENVVELSKLPEQTVKRLSQTLSQDDARVASSIRGHSLMKERTATEVRPTLPSGSIKDMPSYDPDAEISALALTIPSWVSSINRTHSTANLSNTTEDACLKLKKELIGLRETIEEMLTAIKEAT